MSHIFNGLSLDDIEEATILMPASVAGAVCELVAAYRRVVQELAQERARIELLRKAASGES